MRDEAERLASILVAARRSVSAVDGSVPPWSELDADLAARIGSAFGRETGATDSPFWKLGATDQATQHRLGVDGPLVAPLDPDAVLSDVESTVIERGSLIDPRFEPEIGVYVDEGAVWATPCVEIADCRFTGWSLPPWGVVADGTLQGRMLFGPPAEPPDVIGVTVRHEGHEVASGEGTWAEAVGRLDLLPSRQSVRMVATGALTPLLPLAPGLWSFGFGPLGEISVRVV